MHPRPVPLCDKMHLLWHAAWFQGCAACQPQVSNCFPMHLLLHAAWFRGSAACQPQVPDCLPLRGCGVRPFSAQAVANPLGPPVSDWAKPRKAKKAAKAAKPQPAAPKRVAPKRAASAMQDGPAAEQEPAAPRRALKRAASAMQDDGAAAAMTSGPAQPTAARTLSVGVLLQLSICRGERGPTNA